MIFNSINQDVIIGGRPLSQRNRRKVNKYKKNLKKQKNT